MTRLRVVAPEEKVVDQREISMEEAAQEALKVCLAEHPSVILLVWESPKGKINNRVLPDSVMLQRGIISTIYGVTFGDDEEDE